MKFPFHGRRRRTPSRLAAGFAFLFTFSTLALVSCALLVASSLRDLVLDADVVKRQLSHTLEAVIGPGSRVEVGEIGIDFGAHAFAGVRLSDVRVTSNVGVHRPMRLERVDLELAILPLLKQDVQVRGLLISGASIDVGADAPLPGTEPLKLLSELDLRRSFADLHRTFTTFEEGLRAQGLESVRLVNSHVLGLKRLGSRVDDLYIERIEVERDARYIDGVTLAGYLRFAGQPVTLEGSWQESAEPGIERTFRGKVQNVELSAAPRMLRRGHTPIEFDAPLDLTWRVPFGPHGKVKQAFAWTHIDTGRLWFGDLAPSHFGGARIDLRFDPERNSLALLPSRFAAGGVSAVVEGGLAKLRDGTYDFEFATKRLEARNMKRIAAEAGGVALAGRLEPRTRSLHLDRFRFVGGGGSLAGTGRIDLAAWTPGVELDLETKRLDIETLKAFWPSFVARKVRRWLLDGGATGGALVDASLTAAIPPGAIAELRTGRSLGPGELSLSLPFENVSIRTAGDLPPIAGANGVAHIVGTSLTASLEGGALVTAGNGLVNLRGSRLTVPDYLLPGLPASLTVAAKGSAQDVAAVAATNPLRIAQIVGIEPNNVTGSLEIDAKVDTPLILRQGARPTNWTAMARTKNVSLAKPFHGRRVANADLRVEARPGLVKVDGTARVDGTRTRLSLVEPFGPASAAGRATRKVAVRLDAKARKRLGMDLDGYLAGSVDVRLSTAADGWQVADVDLTNAVLDLNFVAWRKGKGVPGRARFRFRIRGGVTEVADLKFDGRGFGAEGKLSLDAEGLRTADLRRVYLSKGDQIRVRVRRTARAYRVAVEGRTYDARALAKSAFAPDAVKVSEDGKQKRRQVVVSGAIERARGHGGVVAKNVRFDLRAEGGSLTELDLAAVIGGRATSAALTPTARGTELRALAEDAGATLRFADLYTRMKKGRLEVAMLRKKRAVYSGIAKLTDFALIGEPKVDALLAVRRENGRDRRGGVRIREARANIRKTAETLLVRDGRLRGGDMALTIGGTLYDARGQAKLKGTFLPAYGLNRMVSAIPFVGLATGEGTKTGLLGITFRLDGAWRSPKLTVNPLSVFAPGVFRKVFE